MPIAFSPPSVSILKLSVAAYLSGSRVLMSAVELSEVEFVLSVAAVELAFAFELAFALSFAFEFVSFGGTQAARKSRPRPTNKPNERTTCLWFRIRTSQTAAQGPASTGILIE